MLVFVAGFSRDEKCRSASEGNVRERSMKKGLLFNAGLSNHDFSAILVDVARQTTGKPQHLGRDMVVSTVAPLWGPCHNLGSQLVVQIS